MSSPLIVAVRSPTASGSWYGEVVRSIGMMSDSWPVPRGVTSRTLLPSRPMVLIAASVRSTQPDVVGHGELTSTPSGSG